MDSPPMAPLRNNSMTFHPKRDYEEINENNYDSDEPPAKRICRFNPNRILFPSK